MRNWLGLACLVVFELGLATAAHAAAERDEPSSLLVGVEVTPGNGPSAADVREAIRAELRVPIAPPSQPLAGGATRALIVAVDRSRVVMSMYRGADVPVARSISLPPDQGARLRAIAWLAGNLARDQVSSIVTGPPPEGPPAIPLDMPALQPPPLQEPPKAEASQVRDVPVAMQTTSTAPVVAPTSGWLVTMAGGPTTAPRAELFAGLGKCCFQRSSLVDGGTNWSLEAHRQTGAPMFGLALDVGRSRIAEGIGAAGFTGSRWVHGRWAFEPTIGVGIELATTMVTEVAVTNSSSSGLQAETVRRTGMRGALYLRGGLTGLVDVSESITLLARAGVHLSTLGGYNDFASWLLGVRVKLP